MMYNDSLPKTLTPSCSAAILADVACDPLVRDLRSDFFYPPKSLSRICTQNCSMALAEWTSSVKSQCGNQTVPGPFDLAVSTLFIPGSLHYLFEFSCLQEAGRYCGPVAALAAARADPGVSPFNYVDDVSGDLARTDDCDECDACLVARLRLQAGSPYFDGPIVAEESLYQSITSSCGIVGKPATTTTLDYFTANPQPTAICCDGSTYNIQSSDDCYSISRTERVGTAWLLADNNLEAYCANFPKNGTLCITHQCTTVTVGLNKTCSDIAAAANITVTQFQAWNPILDISCSNIGLMNGTEMCVDAPGRKLAPPTSTSLPPLTPTVPAAVPTDAAQGSNKSCGRWYRVEPGDFCNLLTVEFGISIEDFRFLNLGINKDCTNLFAHESYCVLAVGNINTYSGRPGYMPFTIDPTATFTGVPFINYTNATVSSYRRPNTPLPTAMGTRDDCVHYFAGDDYQADLNGSTWANNCLLVAFLYSVDLEDFMAWNPSLGNVTLPTCSFKPGARYCGSWYLQGPDTTEESVPDTITTSATSTPTERPPVSNTHAHI
ncbi:hypothetical protein F4777DRAFT_601740 [Nemania sp. FL0916]|nr:hypothetical protein F4777DRAFT_601740 [Nemania sp. FL0916]